MATRLNLDNQTLSQLVRFAIVGFSLAGVYSVIYWYLATFVMPPVVAVAIAFAVAVSIGFVLHSRWSFRGHGGERTHATKFKFFVVSLISYGLNSFWVWLFFSHFKVGPAIPILPMAFVTPAVTFLLNREWVFR